MLYKSGRKSKKIWVDKGSDFYNRSMKSLLQDNYIEIYWTHKEEKSLVAEIFIKTLKSKIYKYMTLTLICMGFLGVRFEVLGDGGVKLPPV